MAARKTGNDIVVKDNRLIEASYRLTLTEQRMILFAIIQARDEQKGLNEAQGQLFSNLPVTIRGIDFAKKFGLDEANAYGQLAEASAKLFQRFAIIHDIHPESGRPRRSTVRWISKASYVQQAGIIQLSFTTDLIPFITRLGDNFTQYRLEKIAGMSSTHAIRMYELLVQYVSIGKRSFDVPWLRERLCVIDEYPAISDFKKWVLNIAIDQINEHSDIDVTWEQRKTGRTVTHFDFTIKAKAEVRPKATKKKPEKIMPPTQDAPQETEEQIAKNKARVKELKQMRKSLSGQLDLLLDQPS